MGKKRATSLEGKVNLSTGGNRVLIFKVGSGERPAGPKDIKWLEKRLKNLGKRGNVVVTHDVSAEVVDLNDFRREQVVLDMFDRGLLTKRQAKKKLGI